MIYRLINMFLAIPCGLLLILFNGFYPIVGYVLGRGLVKSMDDADDLNIIFMSKGPIECIKELFNLLITGGVK